MVAIEGDKSVCSDDTIKEKIADFPPEVRDHELLSKVKGELNCISARAHTHTHTHATNHTPIHTHTHTSDKVEADQLDARLAEAEKVLTEYVGRLEAEERERTDLQELLEVFVWQQRQQLREAKKKLRVRASTHPPHHWCPNYPSLSHTQHYQTKLERVTGVKEELTLKLARLPDLSKLPTSSHGSLAPLPSVGDLFN